MGKSSRVKSRDQQTSAAPGAVGPRQPCPCGSGVRYKNCHGGSTPPRVHVSRPFAGIDGECDLVALREFVPAATVPVTIAGHEDREVILATLLPGAAPAMSLEDGRVYAGLQVQHDFGDASRDLAAVLLDALEGEPGRIVGITEAPGEGPRLQDLLTQGVGRPSVHQDFEYWLADPANAEPAMRAALEQATEAITPTERLTQVEGAYWTDVTSKEYLRWVMPHDERPLLDALARLHVSGDDRLVPGARLVGMFRAHGVLVPVWDLEPGTGAEALEDPVADYAERLAEALADETPLTSAQRSARDGLTSRQVTIR